MAMTGLDQRVRTGLSHDAGQCHDDVTTGGHFSDAAEDTFHAFRQHSQLHLHTLQSQIWYKLHSTHLLYVRRGRGGRSYTLGLVRRFYRIFRTAYHNLYAVSFSYHRTLNAAFGAERHISVDSKSITNFTTAHIYYD